MTQELNNNEQQNRQTHPMLVMRIGNTTYDVNFHFSKTSKENMTQKVFRLLKQDMQAGNC